MLYLRKVIPFVPDERIAVTDLRESLGLSERDIRLFTRFLGLERIATAGRSSVLDLMLAAGERALAGTDRSLVRYLVHAHTVQHIAPPSLRLVDTLRDKLGLGEARSFSMSHQSCVTGLYALKVVGSLLRAEPAGGTALVMMGEKVLSAVMQHLPDTTILGDAAAATLVGLDGPGHELLGFAHRTLGEFHQAQEMPAEMQLKYHQIYIPTLASVLRDATDDAGLELADIALVLPHNVNRFSWSTTARQLGIPFERIYVDNIPRMGHCFCADPFVNLATARAEAAIEPGDAVLMVSAGQGGTFSAAVVRIAEEEG